MESLNDTYVKQCRKCYGFFNGSDEDKICPDCFEGCIEENEIRKREKIAEMNEY